MVTIWQFLVKFISCIMAARLVDLPCPDGPVTRKDLGVFSPLPEFEMEGGDFL